MSRRAQLYEQAAALGDSAAMVNLGLMYENGEGVRRDYRAARGWYEKAAALDNAGGDDQPRHPLPVWPGGHRGSSTTRAPWYERAADLGDAAAMANLAYMYDGGRGVPVDKVKARDWYLKGAEAGNGPAMASVGYLFANGEGGPQDYGKAMEWYRKGADLGNAGAMTNIGFMYENGWGVEQELRAGARLVPQGRRRRQRDLDGQSRPDVREGPRRAESISTTPSTGTARAPRPATPRRWPRSPIFYSNGTGTEADPAAALDWYTKAANLGNIIAMHNLGVAYKDGIGTERNLRRAADLFIQSMQAATPGPSTSSATTRRTIRSRC